MNVIKKFGLSVFIFLSYSNYSLAKDRTAGGITINHTVSGIASDSCGEFYEKYNPKEENYYHVRTIFFIEGFLTAYNYEESLYNENHISSVGQSTDEKSIALMMYNYCLKYPTDKVNNAIVNTFIDLKESNR